MKTKLLTSIAAAALIAGSGAVLAQGQQPGGAGQSPGMSQGGGAPERAPSAQQSAPAEKMKPGTTGQGSPSAPKGQAQDDMKSKSGSSAQSDDKAKAGSTAKGADDKGKAGSTAKSGDDKSKAGSTAKSDDKSKAGSTTGQGAAGASANLTTEQKTKISTSIKQTNVKPMTNVNFNISVGTAVPRSVTLHTLPVTVIEVYPAWRGYRYILVGEEIVIIDPATYRIVSVIVV